MEAVIDVGIEMSGVFLALGLQRRLIVRPALVDPLVQPRIMQQQRRLNLGDIVALGLAAIERHRGRKTGQAHRHGVANATAVAKAHGADLAVRVRIRRQPVVSRDEILQKFTLVERLLHHLAFVVGTRITAQRRQPVRRQRGETGNRDPARNIRDIGV
jgi:hypothetical protein